jgi:hypothetical protein
VLFIGEGSNDYGGPFREMMTNSAQEIQSSALPLMVPTVNNRNEIGLYRNCWTINPSAKSPTHAGLFRLLGSFLGFCARTKAPMDLSFSPIFWKKLIDEKPVREDLKFVDKYTYQLLADIEKDVSTYKPEDFDSVVDETFTTTLSNGAEVELCPGGREKKVTHKNYKEFIDLTIEKRLNEGDK